MNAKVLLSLVAAVGMLTMSMGAATAAAPASVSPSTSSASTSLSGNAVTEDVGTMATCTNDICCVDPDRDGVYEECWQRS